MNLPQRKNVRLQKYDYSQSGAYFVTICAKNRECLFSTIGDNAAVGATVPGRPHTDCCDTNGCSVGADIIRPQLSKYGIVAKNGIENIGKIYQGITVPHYVIMPNHIHMIINIDNGGRMISAPTTNTSVPKIVGYFKRFVSHQIGFSPWQKSFYDHIIRNENDYNDIAEYIECNPAKWQDDRFYVPS